MTALPVIPPKRPGLRERSVGPFPLITLVLVIVIGLAAFVTATYLEMFDDGGGEPRTNGPSTYSRSAVGHRAIAATLLLARPSWIRANTSADCLSDGAR